MHKTEYTFFINRLNTTDSLDEIQAACSVFFAEFGFEKFIYGVRIPTSFTDPDVYTVNGYPEEWRTRYVEANYIAVDPTVTYCSQNILPLDWADLQPLEQGNPDIRKFMDEARNFGLRQGISFPLHGSYGEFAMLSLACSDQREVFIQKMQAVLPVAQLCFVYLHEAVIRVVGSVETASKERRLTAREKECLLWVADGKTSWEIAQILKVSESTVISSLQSAKKKMNASNRQHTVARAVVKRLIAPQLG